jgi:DnaJ-domain-containing protein 1
MYSEKLEKLIELALADGVLTEKEKQVLFKNAEAEGIDLDEFEMVLDAKLFEKQQTVKNLETPVSAVPQSIRDYVKLFSY